MHVAIAAGASGARGGSAGGCGQVRGAGACACMLQGLPSSCVVSVSGDPMVHESGTCSQTPGTHSDVEETRHSHHSQIGPGRWSTRYFILTPRAQDQQECVWPVGTMIRGGKKPKELSRNPHVASQWAAWHGPFCVSGAGVGTAPAPAPGAAAGVGAFTFYPYPCCPPSPEFVRTPGGA